MMDIWEILGIDKTTDEREIKRAYAKMLAKHHPEDEPEKFQEIKEAYEMALQYAKGSARSDESFYGSGEEDTTFDEFSYVKNSNSYRDWRDKYEWAFNYKGFHDKSDSIFSNAAELDQLDEQELEKKRAVIDDLIVTLKAIKEPDITVDKLKGLVGEIDYEMLESNPYFLNFTKELKKYLSTHSSFLARRQHLFAIIKNRFDDLLAEAKEYGEILHGNSGDIYELCVWLAEFEKDLKERHVNIQMNDQQYGKSFTWDGEGSRTFDQQYKRHMKGVDMRRFGQQFKNCLLIMGAVIVLGSIVVTTIPDQVTPQVPISIPQTPIEIQDLIPSSFDDILNRDYLADHETLAPFESDIDQAITEYLFEEYGKEFTTDGLLSNFDFGSMLTLTYFIVDDPMQHVIVYISYKIEGDELEITQIFHTPGIFFDDGE